MIGEGAGVLFLEVRKKWIIRSESMQREEEPRFMECSGDMDVPVSNYI